MSEAVARRHCTQVLSGLAHLHVHRITHGDVKCGNVLLCGRSTKLADFGCSVVESEVAAAPQRPFQAPTGTVPFMAPEVIRQTGGGPPSDIWSVGCAVIEMVSGGVRWGNFSNTLSTMYHIACRGEGALPALPPDASPLLHSFVRECLVREPGRRPTAPVLLSHPWLCSKQDETAYDSALDESLSPAWCDSLTFE